MLKNKSDKKIPEFQLSFENILVCNEKKSKPFLEIIVQDPENIEQQNLGTLIGIFEVSDDSEDSSYIVNYLISIIKKEYFSRPRRGPVESFEAALHKANLALAKLAEHGNINWIGRLNVLAAVLEKNKLHLAQAGTASAFLLRSKTLTNISEGLSGIEAEPNPLKTFDNVSSGKLEAGDKILVATENIFDIFSFEEIKKSALRFSDAEFVQFLRTAMGNELERAAALIVDIREKAKEPEEQVQRRPAKTLNAFSQTAFVKPPRTEEKDKTKLATEIKEELKKEEFADKKTGHIYIKETEQPSSGKDYFSGLSLFFHDLAYAFREKAGKLGKKSLMLLKNSFFWLKNRIIGIRTGVLKEKMKQAAFSVKDALIAPFRKMQSDSKSGVVGDEKMIPAEPAAKKFSPGRSWGWLPDFSRMKDILHSFSYEQKLYTVLVIVAIVFVPYFGLKISRYVSERKVTSQVQEIPKVIVPLELDKNVVRLGALNAIYSESEILRVVNLNGKVFAASRAKIIDLESGEKFSASSDFGEATIAAGMNDLNLIFLISRDKKITTFSPLTKKFQANSINFPENSGLVDAKTYLTYIYILDPAGNQIYRYPRAEGGFGQKSDWLKEPLDLSGATGMAINENIFVADGKNILKLFRGKKQDFNLEQSATPIAPFKIYVQENSANIYVLDKINSRIVKLDASGNIITQYYNSEIAGATDLAVNEGNNTIYFSAPDAIKSFGIE